MIVVHTAISYWLWGQWYDVERTEWMCARFPRRATMQTQIMATHTWNRRRGAEISFFPQPLLKLLCKTKQYYCLICFTLVMFPIPNSFLPLSTHYSLTNKSILTLYGSSLLCLDKVGVSYEIFIDKLLACCLLVQRDIVSYETYISNSMCCISDGLSHTMKSPMWLKNPGKVLTNTKFEMTLSNTRKDFLVSSKAPCKNPVFESSRLCD